MSSPDKERLSFDLPPGFKARLQTLQNQSQMPSMAEVFRRSIALYELFKKVVAEGGKVVFEKADGSRETVHLLD